MYIVNVTDGALVFNGYKCEKIDETSVCIRLTGNVIDSRGKKFEFVEIPRSLAVVESVQKEGEK